MRFRVMSTSAALVGLLCWASVALADNGSSKDGYGGTAGTVQANLTTKPKGSLPFTGMNLTFIAMAAIAVIAVGLVLRRASRGNA